MQAGVGADQWCADQGGEAFAGVSGREGGEGAYLLDAERRGSIEAAEGLGEGGNG